MGYLPFLLYADGFRSHITLGTTTKCVWPQSGCQDAVLAHRHLLDLPPSEPKLLRRISEWAGDSLVAQQEAFLGYSPYSEMRSWSHQGLTTAFVQVGFDVRADKACTLALTGMGFFLVDSK